MSICIDIHEVWRFFFCSPFDHNADNIWWRWPLVCKSLLNADIIFNSDDKALHLFFFSLFVFVYVLFFSAASHITLECEKNHNVSISSPFPFPLTLSTILICAQGGTTNNFFNGSIHIRLCLIEIHRGWRLPDARASHQLWALFNNNMI